VRLPCSEDGAVEVGLKLVDCREVTITMHSAGTTDQRRRSRWGTAADGTAGTLLLLRWLNAGQIPLMPSCRCKAK
jgi:hypothetical protein